MTSLQRNPIKQLFRWSQARVNPDVRHRIALKKSALQGQWLTEDEYRQIQFVELKKLLWHATQTTVYYRELFDRLGLRVEDIRSLSDYRRYVPVLEKQELKQRLDALISNKWRDRCEICRTTGSTASPTPYAEPVPNTALVALWALVDDLCQITGDERTLHLTGRPLSSGEHHVWDPKHNLHRYSFYDLAQDGFQELLDFILRWRPEFVYGYASVLDAVAEALEAQGHTGLGVKIVQSHSEPLYSHTKARMERVFGGHVHNHYGCCEIPHLGVDCREHQGIHLFDHLRLFEVEPISDQEPDTGNLIITDLHNYAMPLLRYRIGDVVQMDRRPCRCGQSLPRVTVQGRTCDLIRSKTGSIVGPVFFEQMMDPAQIIKYMIHQPSVDRMDVHLVPAEKYSHDYGAYMQRQIRDRLGAVDVRLLLEREIDDKIAGKARSIRSDVSAEMARAATANAAPLP